MILMRRFPTEVREGSEPEAPRRTRPADKRRRFPALPKRLVVTDEALPQEKNPDGHDG